MTSGHGFHISDFIHRIFRMGSGDEFNALAMELFRYQYGHNPVYRKFCDHLGRIPDHVTDIRGIPFLPVEFFRDHDVLTGRQAPGAKVFVSSGTTGLQPSRHIVNDPAVYVESFTRSFARFYGDPSQYSFLALLPGYLERPGSSLIFMMEHFIRLTGTNGSGFFLHDLEYLVSSILDLKRKGKKILLFGVTHALLDLAEKFSLDLPGVIIMETGGMKGRRKELIREELHEILRRAFHVSGIHSEYGMTEMLSQAYSAGGGLFRSPPWLKVMIRDMNDPLSPAGDGDTGGVNIIDLANVHSCSFIATQDLGRMRNDGAFEVLGRFDNSDIRGCNLMIS